MKIIHFLFFYCLTNLLVAQTATISGYIRDENGESLVGATAVHVESSKGSSSNQNGFYGLTVPTGYIDLQYSFIGFEKKTVHILLIHDTIINIALEANTQTLNEVEVKSSKDILTNGISTVKLSIEQIKKIPAIGGEVDIIKALGLMPGVSNGTEGSSGLYVRGGTPDQNLILLDDAVVYNPSHLLGFLSVFNPDAIKNVELIKGGFPARYGGRLSSVLDITMREGNYQKRKMEVGIGIISSRFTTECPLIKDKLSLLLSARTSYLGFLLLPSRIAYNKSKGDAEYYNYIMYDLNAKLNYKINDKNQIYLSFYRGQDFYETKGKTLHDGESKILLNWGNTTVTLRHNSIITPKIFLKNILIHSKFFYKTSDYQEKIDTTTKHFYEYTNQSQLSDYTFRSMIDYIPNANHYIKIGAEGIFHKFTPQNSQFMTNDTTLMDDAKREDLKAFEPSLFAEDDLLIGNFKVNYGLRFNMYSLTNKKYYSIEPRISILYKILDDLSVKFAYSKMQQNIHLLTNSGVGLQNDIWVPSTAKVKPQKSEQWTVGLTKYFAKGNIELTIEAYKKYFTDIIDYKEGVNVIVNLEGWENTIQKSGKGYSEGLELLIHKKTGRLSGFASYTLAKSVRQFDSINLGKEYPFRYDNKHVFNITGNFQINKKWDVSATWVYKSGEPITLPLYQIADDPFNTTGRTKFDGLPIYTTRNGYRLPAYHRADIGLNYTSITHKGRIKKWSFSVFNLYNRNNILYIKVQSQLYDYNVQTKEFKRRQVLVPKSLFPIIPSVSYSISF